MLIVKTNKKIYFMLLFPSVTRSVLLRPVDCFVFFFMFYTGKQTDRVLEKKINVKAF